MGRREGTQAQPGTEREGTKPGASHFNSVPGGQMPGKLDHRGSLRLCGWAGSAGGAAGATKGEQGKELGEGRKRRRERERLGHAAAVLELDRLCTVVPGDFFSFPSKSLGSQGLSDLCSSSFLLYLKEGTPLVGAASILVGQGSPTSEYSG